MEIGKSIDPEKYMKYISPEPTLKNVPEILKVEWYRVCEAFKRLGKLIFDRPKSNEPLKDRVIWMNNKNILKELNKEVVLFHQEVVAETRNFKEWTSDDAFLFFEKKEKVNKVVTTLENKGGLNYLHVGTINSNISFLTAKLTEHEEEAARRNQSAIKPVESPAPAPVQITTDVEKFRKSVEKLPN